MYYRLAIQLRRDHLDWPVTWRWTSTALSSIESMFQLLRLYGALPQEQLRVFSSSSREGLEEQFKQENSGEGSASVTAAQFLQDRLIHSRGATSTCGVRRHEGTTSVAVSTRRRLDESGGVAQVLGERNTSSLERRLLEQELGVGGDHDVPYQFALPLSMP
jgi:hypothetical protein